MLAVYCPRQVPNGYCPNHATGVTYTGPVERVEYTPTALRDDPTLEYPQFQGLFLDGRLAVLYSPFDLMSGLNPDANAYAKGVATEDSLRLVTNIITYALSN